MNVPKFEVDPFLATIQQLYEIAADSPVVIGPFHTTGYARDGRFFFGAEQARPEDATEWSGVLMWQPEPPVVEGYYWQHGTQPARGLSVSVGLEGDELISVDTPPLRGIHFESTQEVGTIEVGAPVYDENGWGFEPVNIVTIDPRVMPIIAAQMDQFVDEHALRYF